MKLPNLRKRRKTADPLPKLKKRVEEVIQVLYSFIRIRRYYKH